MHVHYSQPCCWIHVLSIYFTHIHCPTHTHSSISWQCLFSVCELSQVGWVPCEVINSIQIRYRWSLASFTLGLRWAPSIFQTWLQHEFERDYGSRTMDMMLECLCILYTYSMIPLYCIISYVLVMDQQLYSGSVDFASHQHPRSIVVVDQSLSWKCPNWFALNVNSLMIRTWSSWPDLESCVGVPLVSVFVVFRCILFYSATLFHPNCPAVLYTWPSKWGGVSPPFLYRGNWGEIWLIIVSAYYIG